MHQPIRSIDATVPFRLLHSPSNRESRRKHPLSVYMAIRRPERETPTEGRYGPQHTGNGALRNHGVEHFEFPVNPWRPPQRIGLCHLQNESSHFLSQGRPSGAAAVHSRQPSPEAPKPVALPSHYCVRLNEDRCASPALPNP